jgi:hypothetical protein
VRSRLFSSRCAPTPPYRPTRTQCIGCANVRSGRVRLPACWVIGASALRGAEPSQLCRLLGWPHFPHSMAFLHSPVFPPVVFALPHSSCQLPALPRSSASSLALPAPRRKPLALPRSSASASHCAESSSVLLLTSALALPRLGVGFALCRELSGSALDVIPCTSPLLGVSFVLCCRMLSGWLSVTPSAPSPQSGFTDDEVWRVLDAPATKSFKP